MEDDLDYAIAESTKKDKKSSKKGSVIRRRAQATFAEEPDLLEGLGLDDEELDALTPEQLLAEIEKVKTQIIRLEEDLQKEPEVSVLMRFWR
jgi:hypothetical protein